MAEKANTNETTEQELDIATITADQLVAMGYDRETAELMTQYSDIDTGAATPFPILKFNYDQQEVLADHGVKKGELIHGYKVNKQQLKLDEEGKSLGNKMEFFVIASAYRNSNYDEKSKSVTLQTNIFKNKWDSKKMLDNKSGMSIEQLKAAGKDVTFDNIILLMVKEGTAWNPYLMFMHGTSYYEFSKYCDDNGIGNIVNTTTFRAVTKKIPTEYQPAWVLDVKETTARTIADLGKFVKPCSEAIGLFDTWVKETNTEGDTERSGATPSANPAGADTVAATSAQQAAVEEAEEETEIDWDADPETETAD